MNPKEMIRKEKEKKWTWDETKRVSGQEIFRKKAKRNPFSTLKVFSQINLQSIKPPFLIRGHL
jgi:hypothetical protein